MLIATFGPSTGWAGKTITREGDVFTLEGHGPISAADVMEYDRQGQLVWANDGTRAWVGSKARAGDTRLAASADIEPVGQAAVDSPAFRQLPVDIQKIIAKHGGSRAIRKAWVGGSDGSIIDLADRVVIAKAAVPLSHPEIYAEHPYAGITGVTRYKLGPFQMVGIRAEGKAEGTLGTCVSFGMRGSAKADECANYLRVQVGQTEAISDAVAVVSESILLGGHGADLKPQRAYNLVFRSELLEIRDGQEGTVALDIPLSSIQVLEIGGPGEKTSGGGFIGGGFGLEGAVTGMLIGTALNLLTTRTKIDTVICVRTPSAELYFHNQKYTPDVLRIALSKVFERIRELQAPNQAEPSGSPDGPKGVADEIAKLAGLHDAGKLTDDEFAAFKAKLME